MNSLGPKGIAKLGAVDASAVCLGPLHLDFDPLQGAALRCAGDGYQCEQRTQDDGTIHVGSNLQFIIINIIYLYALHDKC